MQDRLTTPCLQPAAVRQGSRRQRACVVRVVVHRVVRRPVFSWQLMVSKTRMPHRNTQYRFALALGLGGGNDCLDWRAAWCAGRWWGRNGTVIRCHALGWAFSACYMGCGIWPCSRCGAMSTHACNTCRTWCGRVGCLPFNGIGVELEQLIHEGVGGWQGSCGRRPRVPVDGHHHTVRGRV